MDNKLINAALRNATDTHQVEIGSGVLAKVGEVFVQSFGEQSAMIIADENTYALAGDVVTKRLVSCGVKICDPFIFPGRPTLYADFKNVLELEKALRSVEAIPVVIGSGTLNDLTKLAAHHIGRKYMVVATAASMDGYTAFGAAITQDGFKQTRACPAPEAVVADLDIICKAPVRMTSSGYADLLGKITSGADWLIADALHVERVDAPVWGLVQNSLRDWTANPQLLRIGDEQAIGYLVEGLILTGLAMQAHQSSRPASGSEHQFSHLWEMHETSHGAVPHGFKVGVGSICSAALYERILVRDFSNLDIEQLCDAWPTAAQVEKTVRDSHSDPVMAEKAVGQSLAKHASQSQLRERLETLQVSWLELRGRLKTQMMTAEALCNLLLEAGCPTRPEEIGWSIPQLKTCYFRARQIRSRYTVFDLAAETGCFEACVDEVFAPGGYWHAVV
ncbi:MAG: sn-glycerol-1-phosphate dehydrogenase [Chloroflexota bacterium]